MTAEHELEGFDMTPAKPKRGWVAIVDTPIGGAEPVADAFGHEPPLVQGLYDNCLFIRHNGLQRFRALEDSRAAAEGAIQETPSAQIVFSIPTDPALRGKAVG